MRFRRLYLAILGLALVGCQKNEDIFVPDELGLDELQGEINHLLAQMPFEEEVFQWVANKSNTFFTRTGARLSFPENAFVRLDGETDLSGVVEVRIKEVVRKGDMIRCQVPTMIGDNLLETFGALHIEAELGGVKLVLKAGVKIDWDIPSEDFNAALDLFYGLEGVGTNVRWVGATEVFTNQEPVRPVKILTPEGASLNAYKAQPQQLGWWSCSRMVVSEVEAEQMQLKIDSPAFFVGQNTAVYLVFENRQTVVPLIWNEMEGDGQFSSPLVPVGEDIIVVAIAEGASGRSFLGFRTIETERSMQTLTLPLVQRSLHTIQLFLNSL
ncbi:MAG: hypothetical protein R2828_23990 [Saprospiraceae bacterium]